MQPQTSSQHLPDAEDGPLHPAHLQFSGTQAPFLWMPRVHPPQVIRSPSFLEQGGLPLHSPESLGQGCPASSFPFVTSTDKGLWSMLLRPHLLSTSVPQTNRPVLFILSWWLSVAWFSGCVLETTRCPLAAIRSGSRKFWS
jgi:hypothetical protein